jgi:hypothetical protein
MANADKSTIEISEVMRTANLSRLIPTKIQIKKPIAPQTKSAAKPKYIFA